eukprot:365321-Chlamydomonas_euryale.AAC.5
MGEACSSCSTDSSSDWNVYMCLADRRMCAGYAVSRAKLHRQRVGNTGSGPNLGMSVRGAAGRLRDSASTSYQLQKHESSSQALCYYAVTSGTITTTHGATATRKAASSRASLFTMPSLQHPVPQKLFTCVGDDEAVIKRQAAQPSSASA